MLKLDNCKHCPALTYLPNMTIPDALDGLINSDLGCWLCQEDGESGKQVWLYEGERVIWKGYNQFQII